MQSQLDQPRVSHNELLEAAKDLFQRGLCTADMPAVLLHERGWAVLESRIANVLAWHRDDSPPKQRPLS